MSPGWRSRSRATTDRRPTCARTSPTVGPRDSPTPSAMAICRRSPAAVHPPPFTCRRSLALVGRGGGAAAAVEKRAADADAVRTGNRDGGDGLLGHPRPGDHTRLTRTGVVVRLVPGSEMGATYAVALLRGGALGSSERRCPPPSMRPSGRSSRRDATSCAGYVRPATTPASKTGAYVVSERVSSPPSGLMENSLPRRPGASGSDHSCLTLRRPAPPPTKIALGEGERNARAEKDSEAWRSPPSPSSAGSGDAVTSATTPTDQRGVAKR